MDYCVIIFANENLSFCNSRMNKILSNSITGRHYMLQPGPQELERGILKYDPDLHVHLWTYVTVEGQIYTNNPELVDWDSGIDEWKEEVMGQWPFGNPPSEDQRILREALDCLDFLDSHLSRV